jgi:subtilisin-like proprotein convertase family protein/uncharacterized protein YvpB
MFKSLFLWLIVPLLSLAAIPASSAFEADPALARENPEPTATPFSPKTEAPLEDIANPTSSLASQPEVYLPLAFLQTAQEPPPPPLGLTTRLFCSAQGFAIPDNDPAGSPNTIIIDDPRFILDLDVRLDADHAWVGDLVFSLTHQETGSSATLIDRPGIPKSENGCGEDNIGTILDDEITGPVKNKCSNVAAAISGIYRPEESLSIFDGERITGAWTLTVSDHSQGDAGNMNEWCLAALINDEPGPPPPEPPEPDLPDSAQVEGVTGQSQALPLDCEIRSAVDWAAYFGEPIDEFEFFNNLPESDNPDIGFVGSVYGSWGQIPPNPYGVHAEPVASQLREYGLPAYAHRPLTWDGLRAEIAAGRPVIAWIVGAYSQGVYDYVVNGIPRYYLPQEGHLTVVVPYEHTVVVTGYTQDSVTYLNGGGHYTRSLEQFLDSWSVMRNMAITTQP